MNIIMERKSKIFPFYETIESTLLFTSDYLTEG